MPFTSTARSMEPSARSPSPWWRPRLSGTPDDGPASAVLSPPALANGQAPLAQVGYPPLGLHRPAAAEG